MLKSSYRTVSVDRGVSRKNFAEDRSMAMLVLFDITESFDGSILEACGIIIISSIP